MDYLRAKGGSHLTIEQRSLRGMVGKHVLVTGNRGYLGTAMVGALADVDCQISCLSRRANQDAQPGRVAGVKWLSGDLGSIDTWQRAVEDSDVVFHFAAQTSLRVAEDDPAADMRHNVLPMILLLESCRNAGRCPIVLFAGTATQVGMPQSSRVDETYPDFPITVYDVHKLMAEQYLKYYAHHGIIRGSSLRLANVYGPGTDSTAADRGVLNNMIRRACEGKTLTIYGTGEHLRDYVYIEDVIRAFLLAADQIDCLSGGHFVIGSGEACTVADALHLVAKRAAMKTGQEVSVEQVEPPVPLAPIEKRRFVADSTRFRQATGWEPRYGLVEGIDQTVEYCLGTSP